MLKNIKIMNKSFLFLLSLVLFIFSIIKVYPFDCKYFEFSLLGGSKVVVNDGGVYVGGSEGNVYVDDAGVKIDSKGSSNWQLIDNRDRTGEGKEGDYYVFFQHTNYKVNLRVTYYRLGNIFYSNYNDFINKIKGSNSNVQVAKSTLPNASDRIVYKVVVERDNGTKSIYYTVSSDLGFYLIEFSGKKDYISYLYNDLKYVLDTFVPKY